MKTSLLKSIRFNTEKKEDLELYEWLSHLPRGEFSEGTKEYWSDRMKSLKDGK